MQNLDKYSYDLLEKINFKYVVLCKNLSVSGSITFSGTVGGDKTKLPLSIEVSSTSKEST